MKKLQRAKELIKSIDAMRDNLIEVIEAGGEFEIEWINTGIQEITSCSSLFKEQGCNGAQKYTITVHPYKNPYSK